MCSIEKPWQLSTFPTSKAKGFGCNSQLTVPRLCFSSLWESNQALSPHPKKTKQQRMCSSVSPLQLTIGEGCIRALTCPAALGQSEIITSSSHLTAHLSLSSVLPCQTLFMVSFFLSLLSCLMASLPNSVSPKRGENKPWTGSDSCRLELCSWV